MRFKSAKVSGFQVFAVTGINTVSFGIVADDAAKRGLLGFAVERWDPTENERYIMPGFKVFPSLVSDPAEDLRVSTWEHPIQSFVWDDFTAKPGRKYEYSFRPLRGSPKNLDRSAKPFTIRIETEELYSLDDPKRSIGHDVFFNRGVASSQAYRRRFRNLPPNSPRLSPKERQAAFDWLTRDLDDALLKFIGRAKRGDTLLCCFYEFRYEPVADALAKAVRRGGVNVRLIVDAKDNSYTDKQGIFHPAFPREDNQRMLKKVSFPIKGHVIFRTAKPNDIQHNKFMVLLKPAGGRKRTMVAKEVWTGSTNISEGGLAGQTNVGHWVRSPEIAEQYRKYWEVLADDPGGKKGQSRGVVRKANDALRAQIQQSNAAPSSIEQIPAGISCVFSPRPSLDVLELYADMLDYDKARCSCVTLAFGVNELFKTQLRDNTSKSPLTFLLLEKRDKPTKRTLTTFVALNAKNNVYQAWGSYIQDPVYQWAQETNAQSLGLNQHVVYVHSKFMLVDPLGKDPIVVTGSANFSEPSTNANDENMLLIRADQRVADIYFTEFNRLFNHYYFRSVHEDARRNGAPAARRRDAQAASLFLDETPGWLKKYEPGGLRAKRLAVFSAMSGARQI